MSILTSLRKSTIAKFRSSKNGSPKPVDEPAHMQAAEKDLEAYEKEKQREQEAEERRRQAEEAYEADELKANYGFLPVDAKPVTSVDISGTCVSVLRDSPSTRLNVFF